MPAVNPHKKILSDFLKYIDIFSIFEAHIIDMKKNVLIRLLLPPLLLVLLSAYGIPILPANSASASAETKEIFLTFDDGPTDSTTPHVLDVLHREHVKATFFVIGRQIAGREEILRRTAREGHAIGIHSQTHEYRKIYASPGALLADIRACRASIRKILPDYTSKLYRYPGGSFSVEEKLRSAVQAAGWEAHDWNASAEDAVQPGATAQTLYKNAVNTAAGKQHIVLLLHDGVNYKETVKALPDIIRHFKEEGYIFKTL